ncbi:MAG: GNAT family N-acetyltransferase [Candidatus Cloacimonetes bacterium]|nr:GNAT family N-acetyltransferase [Candidatus Cloacimonadota bacterium]MCK9584284.1 GNAT family N-acetyltransferase [Candidatus Cloacimonadota bacterium]MDY0228845.1 GNAT family N-acetyltransferase [Candidatus Cloacimonadaceae bacterium]
MLSIVPVDSKKLLSRFIMLPFGLYKDDPNWVAPLIMDQYAFFNPQKNPYYEHSKVQLFLAIEDDKVLGRISAQSNTQHQKEHNEDIGFFGFFDSVDRIDLAQALFQAAGDWNKKQGFASMRGPMNFSVNQEIGLLIDGFDTPPMVMMRHDHPYYQKLYEACGLTKTMDLYAYLSERSEMPERIERLAAAIEKRSGVSIRSLSKNKKELQKDIETVFEIYTKAWEYNWGNVPMTKAEFDHTVAELLPLADPELIFIAEKDGHPAGFSLALPDYNQVLKVMNGHVNPLTMIKALIAKKKINSARVITMGIIKEYQGRGIDTLLYYYAYKNGLPKGIFRGEFSWVLENNTMMIRVAQMLDAIPYKTYRLYDKNI